MSAGATVLAARTSAPVGVTWDAPGTSFTMSLTVVTMPAPVSRVSGCLASCSVVKLSMNPTVWSSNTSFDCTNIPSSLDEPVSRSRTWRSWITCDFWLTHLIGSVCSSSFPSTRMPPANTITAITVSGMATPPGNPPSHTTIRPSGPVRKSLPLVGDLYSRMPSAASGDDAAQADHRDADRQQQPELAEHRHLGEPQGSEGEDGVEGHHQQRRAQVSRRLLDRMRLAVDHHLFLDARVHLDRVVDPYPEHDGQAGDGDDRQRDAEVPGEAEGPDDPDEDHGKRQQAPSHVEEDEQDHDHDGDRDRAERQHAAGQVVVDVLQQDRRACRDDRRVVELQALRRVDHIVGGRALARDRRVADEPRHDLRVPVVDDE